MTQLAGTAVAKVAPRLVGWAVALTTGRRRRLRGLLCFHAHIHARGFRQLDGRSMVRDLQNQRINSTLAVCCDCCTEQRLHSEPFVVGTAIFRQLRNLIRTSITQDGVELDRDGTVRVHECGVRESRYSAAIKGDLDVLLRQPLNR